MQYLVGVYKAGSRGATFYECVNREKSTVFWQVTTHIKGDYKNRVFHTYAEAEDYFNRFEEDKA